MQKAVCIAGRSLRCSSMYMCGLAVTLCILYYIFFSSHAAYWVTMTHLGQRNDELSY